jgi:hypothetical protein
LKCQMIQKAGLINIATLTIQMIMLFTCLLVGRTMHNNVQHYAFGAGQFLSRAFVVLLRKSIPRNRNLKTAA